MGRDYRKQLPSGNSQQQGDNNGVRQTGSPRKQEKPDVNLQVINNRTADKGRMVLYDPKEYEHRVKAVLEGNILESTIRETADMLGQQQNLLRGISLDAMRNNSNKLVNQDMSIEPLEESNRNAENTLRVVAGNIYGSDLMKRYVEEMTKKDREKWQLSEVDKAMMTGGDKACAYMRRRPMAISPDWLRAWSGSPSSTIWWTRWRWSCSQSSAITPGSTIWTTIWSSFGCWQACPSSSCR